ncbi:MAG: hypothetical protein QW797_06305 [Thermoproteota archaeon]
MHEVLISVSSAPIARLGDKEYYDLIGTIDVMKKVFSESVVDGFELQLEPEWDSSNPPLTDRDFADWTKTPKYTTEEILAMLEEDKWVLENSSFCFYEALNKIKNDWKYQGLLTMEPDGRFDGSRFHNFIEAMKTLRTV